MSGGLNASPRFETLDDFVAHYWIRPIPAQGPARDGWPEVESSLRPEACGTWVELSDTRIAAGEQVKFLLNADTDSDRATHARATLTVRPDAVYQQVFAEFLMGELSDSSRILPAKALEKTADSPYVIFDDMVRIER